MEIGLFYYIYFAALLAFHYSHENEERKRKWYQKQNEEEPQQYTKIHRYFGVIDAIAIVFLCNTKKEKQHYFSFENMII